MKDVSSNNSFKSENSVESESQSSDSSKKNKKTDSSKKHRKLRKSLKSELFAVVLVGQVCFLIILIVSMVLINVSSKPLDIPLSDYKSDYIKFKDGSWYADASLVHTDEDINLVRSPKLDIGEGSYLITVDYECASQQTCYAISNAFVKSSRGRMVTNANSVSFRVDVNQSVNNFEVVVRYNGTGYIRVNNISICEDHSRVGRDLVYALLIFGIFDIWYFYAEKIRRNKTTVLMLAMFILFTSLPLFTGGIGRGHDLGFHIIRIEAIADSLKHGVFPNRLSNIWFDGYGYPASIYYGDILLYIPAVLRLLGFTVVTAYKIYILTINAATVVFGYLCFKGMIKDRYSALMATLVYSTATYRMVNIYVRSAVGEYTAMLFLPIVAYGMYKIYTDDMSKTEEWLKGATILALGMTGLVGCHILTTEMVCLVLGIVCLVLIRKTVKPVTLRALGFAVLETLLLSAYFIVPFIDYYLNVTVNINNIVDLDTLFIQGQGCSIAEYFAVFRDIFTVYSVHNNRRLASTPGLILMFALLVGIAALVYQKKGGRRRELGFYVGFSVMSLFLASDIFPWDRLAARSKIGGLLAQVQFPWRYVSIAVVFMSLILAWLFRKFIEKDFGRLTQSIRTGVIGLTVLAAFLMSAIFTGAYIDDIALKYWRDIGELDPWAVCAGEYLLDDFNTEMLKGDVKKYNVSAKIVEKDVSKLVIYCESNDEDNFIDAPIFNYKGYVVSDDYGNVYDIEEGSNSTIRVRLPKDFKGNITIEFVVPWYWRAGEIASLAALIALAAWYIFELRKKNSKKHNLPQRQTA